MDRRIDGSEGARDADLAVEAPLPGRRAVLRAAAGAPVILTLMAGPAHAIYNEDGTEYFPGLSMPPDCDVAPQDPPR